MKRRPDAPVFARRPKPKPKDGEQPLSGDSATLKLIPLGGNEEVGRNSMIVQFGQEIIIVDLGLQFPEEDMPGVDYIIPDISYLKGKEKWIRGIFITHGHYDHTGGIPHLIDKLGNPPIFASNLTAMMIQKKMEDIAPGKKIKLNVVKSRDRVKLGNFRLEFFGVSHNIPASLGVAIETPAGVVVHTGDFKIDEKAHISNRTDFEAIKSLAKKNILCLLCDSTNASAQGAQIPEDEIQKNLETMFTGTKGRMIFGTFASLLSRVQQIMSLAEKYNRKVLIEGFSMKTNVEIGKQLGYIRIKPNTIVSWEEAKRLPPERLMIICTGAQGEDNAVLMRIANREHKYLQIEKGDLVVFSSSVVPGNERSVQRLKDGLYREGADVIDYKMLDIHAGGHAKAEDIVKFIQLLKPKYFMPVEGNYSFLIHNRKNAVQAGMHPDNVLIADNGQIVEFQNGRGYVTNHRIPIEYIFVDGLGVGDVNTIVLRDRKQLAGDGMVIAVGYITRTGKVQKVDIISRGFTHMKDQGRLIREMAETVRKALQDKEPRVAPDDHQLREKVRKHLEKFIFQKTNRQPMILPVVIQI